MTDVECICGFKEDIKWNITASKPKQMDIHFECPKCERMHTLQVTFPENPKDKPKIEKTTPNYFG